ncbi:hypothetical protein BDQ94DRAFT_155733 [Aspergillus welwitschiae]|uniref:Uncharacterized protein n=1 Tax=Aspergillus welwitschiae TaxID=1341132 RepID=A0A3F3PHG7_9EURO|nr:hypothetical protein BDQ94DRAFT_155733 [Aspergillus welwitschiae]RDH26328.1 hypothetical protein BDQ94DRAFT_155733 [Aspergillus welwitschiae]
MSGRRQSDVLDYHNRTQALSDSMQLQGQYRLLVKCRLPARTKFWDRFIFSC